MVKYVDYELPLEYKIISVERGRTIGHQKLARATGARQTTGYRNGIRITVDGGVYKGPLTPAAHRARQDAIRAGLASGPGRLYISEAGVYTRYYGCMEPESEPDTFGPTGWDRISDNRIVFIGPDPLAFDVTGDSDTLAAPSSGATLTVSVGGNAPAAPKISLTVGGSGLETIDFTVTNNTTAEIFTLAGDVTAGDVIDIDSLAKSVKISTVNRLDLFDGLFPRLDVGDNELQFDYAASSITNVDVEWIPRWE